MTDQLTVKTLKREFILKTKSNEIQLTDPNPDYSAQQVLEHHTRQYPELAVAKVPSKPKLENDKMIYVFETTVGTKG